MATFLERVSSEEAAAHSRANALREKYRELWEDGPANINAYHEKLEKEALSAAGMRQTRQLLEELSQHRPSARFGAPPRPHLHLTPTQPGSRRAEPSIPPTSHESPTLASLLPENSILRPFVSSMESSLPASGTFSRLLHSTLSDSTGATRVDDDALPPRHTRAASSSRTRHPEVVDMTGHAEVDEEADLKRAMELSMQEERKREEKARRAEERLQQEQLRAEAEAARMREVRSTSNRSSIGSASVGERVAPSSRTPSVEHVDVDEESLRRLEEEQLQAAIRASELEAERAKRFTTRSSKPAVSTSSAAPPQATTRSTRAMPSTSVHPTSNSVHSTDLPTRTTSSRRITPTATLPSRPAATTAVIDLTGDDRSSGSSSRRLDTGIPVLSAHGVSMLEPRTTSTTTTTTTARRTVGLGTSSTPSTAVPRLKPSTSTGTAVPLPFHQQAALARGESFDRRGGRSVGIGPAGLPAPRRS